MSVQTVNKLYDYSIKCCFFQYTQIISHLIEVKNKITINLQHYIHIKFTQSSYKIHSCVCPGVIKVLLVISNSLVYNENVADINICYLMYLRFKV